MLAGMSCYEKEGRTYLAEPSNKQEVQEDGKIKRRRPSRADSQYTRDIKGIVNKDGTPLPGQTRESMSW